MINLLRRVSMGESLVGPVLILVTLGLSAGCRKTDDRAGAGAAKASVPIVMRDVGFMTPESVLHDPITDRYLVSNINGSPLESDDNGFISLVADDGKVLSLKWIDGATDSVTLNAPKGMAVIGDYLYVADLTVLRRFDRRTGAPRGEFTIPGATFLNDVAAAEDGSVYFTDSGLRGGPAGFEPSGTDAVYRLTALGKLDTLAVGESLGRPNGIALAGDSVWVVGFGSGELYRVADGARTDIVKLPAGSPDGLVIAFGDFFISSWNGETVFRGPRAGPFAEILHGLKSPADLGHDRWRNRLLIPLFYGNEIRIVPLAP